MLLQMAKLHSFLWLNIFLYIYICMCICVCVCIYIYMYTPPVHLPGRYTHITQNIFYSCFSLSGHFLFLPRFLFSSSHATLSHVTCSLLILFIFQLSLQDLCYMGIAISGLRSINIPRGKSIV